MTQSEFTQILDSLDSLSPEQMRTLRRELESRLASRAVESAMPATDEPLQSRLFQAGLLSEIKSSIRVPTGTEQFTPVSIQGESLSETIIQERR
jgi:hypothetical protein